MKNKVFPQWFIESVVDDKIRDSLLKGEISSRETIQFRCDQGHIFSRRIDNYINCTTMEKKTECPECKKNNRRKYPKELLELLIQEDKEKSIKGSLKSSDMVTIICPKGHKSTFFLGTKVDLSDGILKTPLCHVCSKEKQKENYINNHKKEFPQWFIDSLLYEEDKEKARKGILCSEDPLYFKCSKGHITKGTLYNKIRVSDMTPKNTICSICGMEEAQAKRKQTVKDKWVFPEWFINELVNEEDKEKARSHTLSGTEEVELCCPRGHHYKKKVSQRLNLDGSSNYGCEQCFREDQSIKATPYFEYPQWFIDELVDEKDIELAKIGKLPVGKKVKIKCPNCGSTYIRHVRLEMDVVTKERRKICNKCRLEAKKINPLLNRPDYPEWFIDMLVNEEDKEKARTKMLRFLY